MNSYIQDVVVRLSPAQLASLQPYSAPGQRVPDDRCFDICRSGSGMPYKRPTMCGFHNPKAADVQANTSPDSDALICRYHISEVMAAGRRPSGLQPNHSHESAPVAAWLADAARLEAAAVLAFSELHDELFRIGAPASLRDGCKGAIADERRHAALMQQQARTAGCEPAPPIVAPSPPRSLFALARDNAVEGCVRESFGALEATWQSHSATDPALRSAMAQIAQDEARHAELAFALHDWLKQRLTPSEREQIRAAQREAFQQIWRDLGTRRRADPALGLPDGALGQQLFHEMMSSLCPHVRLA